MTFLSWALAIFFKLEFFEFPSWESFPKPNMAKIFVSITDQNNELCDYKREIHGLFLEGVYKIELDTKTEYEGF
jgi:hypothetical protein